jgi:restriction endonuclease S subunit
MDFDKSDRAEFRLKHGDVLVCEGGAGVGQTAIWRDELPECYFQKSLHRVRPLEDKATPEYIAYLMWTLMKGSSLLRSISSATIPHLTGEKLKDILIPVPPLQLQQHFSNQCQTIARLSSKAAENLKITDDLFNSLVQQAFRGAL